MAARDTQSGTCIWARYRRHRSVVQEFKNAARHLPGALFVWRRLRSWRIVHTLPEGPTGFATFGHRAYVGGRWELLQQLQFDFMVSRGLRPEHHIWDIGC